MKKKEDISDFVKLWKVIDRKISLSLEKLPSNQCEFFLKLSFVTKISAVTIKLSLEELLFRKVMM